MPATRVWWRPVVPNCALPSRRGYVSVHNGVLVGCADAGEPVLSQAGWYSTGQQACTASTGQNSHVIELLSTLGYLFTHHVSDNPLRAPSFIGQAAYATHAALGCIQDAARVRDELLAPLTHRIDGSKTSRGFPWPWPARDLRAGTHAAIACARPDQQRSQPA